jgi:hypothetical protein
VDALYANGFEDALIGVGYQFNTQLAVYDWDKCVTILMERDHMDYDEATEFMSYNVTGAWVGKNTPVFIKRGKKTQCDSCGEVFSEERDGFAVTNLDPALCSDCHEQYEEESLNG